MKQTILNTVVVKNFKAIVNSQAITLTPLTVLIGNNGSGKSSLVESLRTLQTFVAEDIDEAMDMWKGIEHVRNKATRRSSKLDPLTGKLATKPISTQLRGRIQGKRFVADTWWNGSQSEQLIFVERERYEVGTLRVDRDRDGTLHIGGAPRPGWPAPRSAIHLPLLHDLEEYIKSWQFLSLSPQNMGQARATTRSRSQVTLAEDGANIAEYLKEIQDADSAVFEGIIDSLRYVLPYAGDVQITGVTTEIERAMYLQMTEKDFKVPGWMLSTGTLRILAILAALRHPKPPPLVVIEEIENGLDPRTLNLVAQELQAASEAGIQVIVTTHSPYFLDAVPLESVVLVDRQEGQPAFTRPADDKEVRAWAKEFTTGRLYTMSRLNTGRAQ